LCGEKIFWSLFLVRKHCKRKKFSAAPPHTGRPFFGFGNVDALIRDVTRKS
jgi:hypothetical protein